MRFSKQSKTSVRNGAFTPLSKHSEVPNKRDLKMRSPQPTDGRVTTSYGYQG